MAEESPPPDMDALAKRQEGEAAAAAMSRKVNDSCLRQLFMGFLRFGKATPKLVLDFWVKVEDDEADEAAQWRRKMLQQWILTHRLNSKALPVFRGGPIEQPAGGFHPARRACRHRLMEAIMQSKKDTLAPAYRYISDLQDKVYQSKNKLQDRVLRAHILASIATWTMRTL